MDATKIYAGMELALVDTTDGGTLNRVVVAPSAGQTVEAAYRAAIKSLELKREGWRNVYPNSSFQIKQK